MPGCRFQLKWLDIDKYKIWLSQAKNENNARCKLCQRDIFLAEWVKVHLGRMHLVKHQALVNGKSSSAVSMKSFITFNSTCTIEPLILRF